MWQVKKKQEGRFTAMIKDEYGGTVCLKNYLETALIQDRKITRKMAHAAKPLPEKRRRLEDLAKRQKKRDRYYRKVAQRIENNDEELPRQSTWVKWHVGRKTQVSSNTQ